MPARGPYIQNGSQRAHVLLLTSRWASGGRNDPVLNHGQRPQLWPESRGVALGGTHGIPGVAEHPSQGPVDGPAGWPRDGRAPPRSTAGPPGRNPPVATGLSARL
ncbi:hypothetical protein NHX12_024377 [Muraenolepis orangiensis]|uniref:Uncharacterized protein n=1 Tax=Muraenolepis orangiensis TaxID=630683 RepID=A0A9Q0EKW0_9TELE|nr:hypothetical protein NHX12_024377 [Muraenolepis orangiensis]